MAERGPEVGSAHVKITADTNDLNANVDKAKAKVDELGKGAQASMSRMGKAVEIGTEGVRKFTSAISSVVGVFTAWVGIIGLATTAIITLGRALSASKDNAADLKEEFAAINEVLAATIRRDKEFLESRGISPERLAEMKKELREVQIELRKVDETIATLQDRQAIELSAAERQRTQNRIDQLNRDNEARRERERQLREILKRESDEARKFREQALVDAAKAAAEVQRRLDEELHRQRMAQIHLENQERVRGFQELQRLQQSQAAGNDTIVYNLERIRRATERTASKGQPVRRRS